MATGDLVTADWQMEYNGVALGDGSPFLIAQVEGLLSLPDIVNADRERLRRHGLTPGDDFTSGRTVTLTLEVSSNDTYTFAEAVDLLMNATAPGSDEQPLVLQVPGVAGSGKRRVNCRPRRRSLPIGREFYYELPMATVEFYATDPRVYDDTEQSKQTTLPSAGGGLSFDAVAPFTFGAVSVGGTLNLNNAGSFQTSPTIVVEGPVTNPTIESLTAGKTLGFTITLGASDTLTIDTENRTVLLNGTANRYNTLDSDSEWFTLQPGNNEVRYQASTFTASTMTITWRSAWV